MKRVLLILLLVIPLGLSGCGGPSEHEINQQIVEDSLNNIREINEAQEKSEEVRDLLESLR